MKFTFYCTTCALENEIDTVHDGIEFDIRDDGIYNFMCKRGHVNLVELQQERFELLFEIAIRAIKDNYYREAVSSFTAALERFYEFCIRIYVIKVVKLSGIELTLESFNASWKQVAKMSERQYGAYIFLHTALVGATPKLQSNEERAFRNRVIHEGIYSTKSEALKYGESIMVLLLKGIQILQITFAEELEAASLWNRMDVRSNAPPGNIFGTIFYPTTISLIEKVDSESLTKKLAQLHS